MIEQLGRLLYMVDSQYDAVVSIRRHFVGIEFDQPQSAIDNVLSFIDPPRHLNGPYQEIAADHKGKVALQGWLEGAADDGGVVDTGNRGGDVQFGAGFIEELHGDPGKRSGACVLQSLEKRNIERNLSIADHPWFPRHRWLAGGGRG